MKYLLCAALLAVSLPAAAREKVMLVDTKSCGYREEVNLSVSFNLPAESFVAAKTKFDEKIKQVEAYAKEQKITQFVLQSANYNINSQNRHDYSAGYQLSGNMNYRLDSFANGVKLAEYLDKQKLQVNLNSNTHRNGNCAN